MHRDKNLKQRYREVAQVRAGFIEKRECMNTYTHMSVGHPYGELPIMSGLELLMRGGKRGRNQRRTQMQVPKRSSPLCKSPFCETGCGALQEYTNGMESGWG